MSDEWPGTPVNASGGGDNQWPGTPADGHQPVSAVEGAAAPVEESRGRLPGGMGAVARLVVDAAPNVPGSAVRFATDVVQPIIHPIDTVKSIATLGSGVLQKLGLRGGTEDIAAADAVGRFLLNRYGSAEAIDHTIRTDPVGIAADVSMILSGGGTAAARAPGMIGRFGEVAANAGRAIDPLAATVRGAAAVAPEAIGLMTHTGAAPLRQAAAAGREGGAAAEAFSSHMRGAAPVEQAVQEARKAVTQLRKERGAEYTAGMKRVGADTTILNFDKVEDALIDISKVKTYKGQVIDDATQTIRQRIGKAVQEWRVLDPAEFHTPEGIDALKQRIGSIRDATQYGTPERVVADRAYQAIRQTIIDQVPEYAKVMKGYEEASTQLRAIEQELSLANPNRGRVDTALRKLQSALRNNVNTNFGRREDLVRFLTEHGSPNLMHMLAGQALNAWLPRGLGKLAGAGTIEAIMAALGAGHGTLGSAGAMAATLPLMSPRLMGEAAFLGGKASRYGGTGRAIGQGAFQTGRTALESSPLAPPNF